MLLFCAVSFHIQPLGNLKKLSLIASSNLEELPDLANAKNLEILDVSECHSLVEIPSSVGNLHKLERLQMEFCSKLQVVPPLFNLASLETVSIAGCNRLRKLPDISTTITKLGIVDTMLEEFTASIRLWSHLEGLTIAGSVIPYELMTQLHLVKSTLERSGADIERIPDCMKDLHGLKQLRIIGCPKLASLPELPRSLTSLMVWNCESLEILVLPFPFDSQIVDLQFSNCFKLGPKARRAIIQQSWHASCLPGRDIPAEFNHQAIGNSLTISSNACGGFKMCLMVSPKSEMKDATCIKLICGISINGCSTENWIFPISFGVPQSEHLAIFYSKILREDDDVEQYSEILFEFSSSSQDIEIIECGVLVLVEETNSEQLLENDDGSLFDESFELDESRVEIIDDLHGSLEYDDASGVETHDDLLDLFAPTFFSFGF